MTDLALPNEVSKAEFYADFRRVDGRRTLWNTSSSESVVCLNKWDLVDGIWVEAVAGEGATWVDAVIAVPEALSVRADQISEYVVLDPEMLLELLAPTGEDLPDDFEWPTDISELMNDEEVYDEGHIRRRATVNGQRLSWAKADAKPVPFLGSWDVLDGDQIASFSWDNGWGSGNSKLVVPRDGVALESSWVDQGETTLWGYRCERGQHGLVATLTSWTSRIDWPAPGSALLALALEPLDPGGTLTADQRSEWDLVLRGVGGGWGEYKCFVELDVSAEVQGLLRTAYAAHDDIYNRFKLALERPLENGWLRDLLDEWDTRGGEW